MPQSRPPSKAQAKASSSTGVDSFLVLEAADIRGVDLCVRRPCAPLQVKSLEECARACQQRGRRICGGAVVVKQRHLPGGGGQCWLKKVSLTNSPHALTCSEAGKGRNVAATSHGPDTTVLLFGKDKLDGLRKWGWLSCKALRTINLAAINLHAEGRPTSLASSTKYKPRGSAFSSLYLSNKRDSAGFSPCKKTLLGRFAIQNSHTAVRRVLDLGELWCDALRSRASANKTFAKGFGIDNNKITKTPPSSPLPPPLRRPSAVVGGRGKVYLLSGAIHLLHMDGHDTRLGTGDLLQWTDVSVALQGLGYEVIDVLSWKDPSGEILGPPHDMEGAATRALFFDYVGLVAAAQHPTWSNVTWSKIASKIRVIDAYGTSPDIWFNRSRHREVLGIDFDQIPPALFDPRRGMTMSQFGAFEPEPETSNFHVGYVIPPQRGAQNMPVHRRHVRREWKGLLWGKDTKYFLRFSAAFKIICASLPLFATVREMRHIPCVKKLGVLPPEEYHERKLEFAVFIGAGDPMLGHGAVEAVAAGMLFLNPVFEPPRRLAGKPGGLHGWRFQNSLLGPSAEGYPKQALLGPVPRVLNVNLADLASVRKTIKRAREIWEEHGDKLDEGVIHPGASVDGFLDRMERWVVQP